MLAFQLVVRNDLRPNRIIQRRSDCRDVLINRSRVITLLQLNAPERVTDHLRCDLKRCFWSARLLERFQCFFVAIYGLFGYRDIRRITHFL